MALAFPCWLWLALAWLCWVDLAAALAGFGWFWPGASGFGSVAPLFLLWIGSGCPWLALAGYKAKRTPDNSKVQLAMAGSG
jgi:hypothetical protein